jgi:hypothetical protein
VNFPIFGEKSRNNKEVLTTFGSLIIEVIVPQLLLESPQEAKALQLGIDNLSLFYTQLSQTNEPARTITLDRRPKEKRGCVRS